MMDLLQFVLPLVVAGLSFVAGFAAGVWKAAKMQARREYHGHVPPRGLDDLGMVQPTELWPKK